MLQQRYENPFASHRTRPGALPFCFPDGCTAESLVDRFSANGWWGQIVGPHGAGKSTLLAALLPVLRERSIVVRRVALHDGQRRLPHEILGPHESSQQLVIIIDGYEQLSLRWKSMIRWRCWRRGWGLLITTHTPAARLPPFVQLAPSGALVQRLFDRLIAGHAPLIGRFDAEVSYSLHGGNVREVWFDLYDRYERNQRKMAGIEA